jgi:hypothetical protein
LKPGESQLRQHPCLAQSQRIVNGASISNTTTLRFFENVPVQTAYEFQVYPDFEMPAIVSDNCSSLAAALNQQ